MSIRSLAGIMTAPPIAALFPFSRVSLGADAKTYPGRIFFSTDEEEWMALESCFPTFGQAGQKYKQAQPIP